MSSPFFTLQLGEHDEFKRILFEYLTVDDVRKINKNPGVVEAMAAAMRQHPAFRLRHGRFTSLKAKLAQVKQWPTILERFGQAGFRLAVEEAEDAGRLRRFREASPTHQHIDAIIVPYLEAPHLTFSYARDRMAEAFGQKFQQWREAYGAGIDEKRLSLISEVTDHRNRPRIEVVDFGAHFNPKGGMIPGKVQDQDSAHAAVIFAASQNPEWPRKMNGKVVPYALAGGYELTVPGHNDLDMPDVWRGRGQAKLGGGCSVKRYFDSSLPSLWE